MSIQNLFTVDEFAKEVIGERTTDCFGVSLG
jgi:hypothetical protein